MISMRGYVSKNIFFLYLYALLVLRSSMIRYGLLLPFLLDFFLFSFLLSYQLPRPSFDFVVL